MHAHIADGLSSSNSGIAHCLLHLQAHMQRHISTQKQRYLPCHKTHRMHSTLSHFNIYFSHLWGQSRAGSLLNELLVTALCVRVCEMGVCVNIRADAQPKRER